MTRTQWEQTFKREWLTGERAAQTIGESTANVDGVLVPVLSNFLSGESATVFPSRQTIEVITESPTSTAIQADLLALGVQLRFETFSPDPNPSAVLEPTGVLNVAILGDHGASPEFELGVLALLLSERTTGPVGVCVSTGTSYFADIAKLRAVRRLVRTIAHETGATFELLLNARVTPRVLATGDVETNVVRNSVAAAAMFIGGADVVGLVPHDLWQRPTDDSVRLAATTLLTLREEAKVSGLEDPAHGAHGLEALTESLCVAAWTVAGDLHAAGGLKSLLSHGALAKTLADERTSRRERLQNGTLVRVGVNKFVPANDRSPSHVSLSEESWLK